MNQFAALALIAILMTSCQYHFNSGAGEGDNFVVKANQLSYQIIERKVLAPKCLSCHSGKEEPNLTTYADVKANLKGIFENSVATNDMPPGPNDLSSQQKDLLTKWIEAGSPEFGSEGSQPDVPNNNPLPDTEKINWNQIKTQILDQHCLSCHFSGNSDGISTYEDYETVKATIGTIYYTVSIQPVMPPAPENHPEDQPNPNQLSLQNKKLLSDWINLGMPKD